MFMVMCFHDTLKVSYPRRLSCGCDPEVRISEASRPQTLLSPGADERRNDEDRKLLRSACCRCKEIDVFWFQTTLDLDKNRTRPPAWRSEFQDSVCPVARR